MLSKITENEPVELQDAEEKDTDVIVDDYKDLEIEILGSTRDKTLWWMKDYD